MNSLQSKLSELQKAVKKQELVFNCDKNIYADFVDNNPLPVVLVKEDGSVLYSNKAMDDMIGCQVCGKSSYYYLSKDEYSRIQHRLKSGKVNGLDVTLRKCNGQTIHCQAYVNVHRDKNGNWINTRCTFVPLS